MTWPLPLPSLMFLSLTLLILQHAVVPVKAQNQAQIQAPVCLPAAMAVWNWTYNGLNQSPCQTAAYLAAQCNNEQFTIPQLEQGSHYTGPSGSDAGDICRCNSVYYSLISACVGCQKGVWIPYDEWNANCTTVSPMSTFPESINNVTGVPAWAFVNVSDTKPWDNVTACAVGDSPESSGTSRPSFAPQFDEGNAVRVGVIAGVAVGCTIAVLAIVGVGAWFLLRRYRQRRQQDRPVEPQPEQYSVVEQENDQSVITPWTGNSDKKFYDPSDPSTYPDPGVLSPASSAANPAATYSTVAVNEPSTANSTDHSATEYSSQHPGHFSYSNRYSGYPEI